MAGSIALASHRGLNRTRFACLLDDQPDVRTREQRLGHRDSNSLTSNIGTGLVMKNCYDCIVIGGGSAGSTAAAIVAGAGFATMLVERDKVPRFHVGESLMPEVFG